MDAGKRQETPESKTKDFIAQSPVGNKLHVCIDSTAHHFHRVMWTDPGRSYAGSGLAPQVKNTKFKKLHSEFYNRLQTNLPELCPRTKHYLYYPDKKQICPLPQKEVLSLSSTAVCYINNFVKMVQDQKLFIPLLKDLPKKKKKKERAMENCLSTQVRTGLTLENG